MATLMTNITKVQLAVLKTVDGGLARAHAEVHARVESLEATMRKARRTGRTKKGATKKPVVLATARAA